VKILNVFNHYRDAGGEAHAIDAISASLSEVLALERCDFTSNDWIGPEAPPVWKQAALTLWNPQSLKKIRDHNQRFKPDVWLVHNILPVGSAAIYREAMALDVPIIQYAHNFRPFSVNGSLWANNQIVPDGLSGNFWPEIRHAAWQNSRLKTAWLAFALWGIRALGWWRSVKAWIAISDFMRHKFIEAGVPAKDVFALRHFWKPRQTCSEMRDGTHYLYLGRLTEAKGILALLDVWEILEREAGSATPQLLIGGDGSLRSVVSSRAERMRFVRFAGPLSGDAKNQALEGCRAMIVPSLWWEPLGLVVYEAYEYCRPVLAACSGGLPEIVLDGETGILHRPGDAEQLARQVLELESDGNRRYEMGRKGRAWLEQHADEMEWREKFSKIVAHALAAKVE
jgi:glycosyltransferase involved in cell wall biosynthesis